MCILCKGTFDQFASRRDFLKGAAATGAAAAALNLFAPRPAAAHDDDDGPPRDTGRPGPALSHPRRRRHVDGVPGGRRFVRGDVLVEGKKILAIGPNLRAGGADVIDARGRIVMPGFIDTHHHQAWTAIRSSIPDSILINDGTGTPSAQQNYFATYWRVRPGRVCAATTGRRTSTSANCSAGSRSSTTASRPSTTFRRSITRRSTPMPPSRR